jgi:hypothetical protein
MTTADRGSLRYRVIADLPMIGAFPILAQLEGSRRRTGIIVQAPGLLIPHLADQGPLAPPIALPLETRLTAAEPLRVRPAVPDRTRRRQTFHTRSRANRFLRGTDHGHS